MDTRNDVRISGSGTVGGGVYNDVRISGSGKISADIECNSFNVSGSGHVDGAIKASSIHVSGSAHFQGDIKTKDLKVSGAADCNANAECDYLKVSGSFKCSGTLDCENIDISGSLDTANGISAENFYVNGMFKTNGMLNAGNIDIKVHHWRSTAKEIGGSKISVRRSDDFFTGFLRSVFSPGRAFIFETETIEGDDVYLEYTSAKIVRGNTVKLGPGCQIDLVEYKTSLEKDADSVVKQEKHDVQ